MSKTETAWKILEERFQIRERLENNESILITAEDIKVYTRREPRLMMKFDARHQRPSVIRKATIFPVTNGEYLIVPGDGYHSVEPGPKNVENWHLPDDARALQTLPWDDGPVSESQMLDMAYASGLLNQFLDEASLHLTIRGRRRSPSFTFRFQSHGEKKISIAVDGVQVEVDAGYEGESLYLIEAKMGGRDDFHTRQLYYPFRMWRAALTASKKVMPVFIYYSDRVLFLRQYRFSDAMEYQSLELVNALNITFDGASLEPTVENILESTYLIEPPDGTPFPQADSLPRVLDLVDAVYTGLTTVEDLVERYEFTTRQVAYYSAAARFLGLMEVTRADRVLTSSGVRFAKSLREKRHTIIIERLASLPVFRTLLQEIVQKGVIRSTRQDIAEMIQSFADERAIPMTYVTANRRASTVIAWLRWVQKIRDN